MKLLLGRELAEEMKSALRDEVKHFGDPPRLAIVMVGVNKPSETFVSLKEKFAHEAGIETRRYQFENSITSGKLREAMKDIVHESRNDGVIVQLPLPSHVDTQSILNAIVPEKDVDVLSARSVGDFQVGKEKVLPPVVGAVELLFQNNGITVKNKKAVVVGYGRLVGQPLMLWLAREGAQVTTLAVPEHFDRATLRAADIIISGVGKAGLITADDVREGVVLVDVGTSEEGGELRGDVSLEAREKAAFATPEKGGVGPLTVALVFQNLVALKKLRKVGKGVL